MVVSNLLSHHIAYQKIAISESSNWKYHCLGGLDGQLASCYHASTGSQKASTRRAHTFILLRIAAQAPIIYSIDYYTLWRLSKPSLVVVQHGDLLSI